MDILSDIIEILVGGIRDFGTGLATGMNGFLKNLFLDYTTTEAGVSTYNGLSTFGTVVVVMGAIALAVGITRYIVGMVKGIA